MSSPKPDARKEYSPSRALRRGGGNNLLCQNGVPVTLVRGLTSRQNRTTSLLRVPLLHL